MFVVRLTCRASPLNADVTLREKMAMMSNVLVIFYSIPIVVNQALARERQ
jgi:hypothetical protein